MQIASKHPKPNAKTPKGPRRGRNNPNNRNDRFNQKRIANPTIRIRAPHAGNAWSSNNLKTQEMRKKRVMSNQMNGSARQKTLPLNSKPDRDGFVTVNPTRRDKGDRVSAVDMNGLLKDFRDCFESNFSKISKVEIIREVEENQAGIRGNEAN